MKCNIYPGAEAKAQVCKVEVLQVTLENMKDAEGYNFLVILLD